MPSGKNQTIYWVVAQTVCHTILAVGKKNTGRLNHYNEWNCGSNVLFIKDKKQAQLRAEATGLSSTDVWTWNNQPHGDSIQS